MDISVPLAHLKVFPLSSASSEASSSEYRSMRSANLLRSSPRRDPEALRPHDVSKARLAATTARSTSLAVPSATAVNAFPVAGWTRQNICNFALECSRLTGIDDTIGYERGE